MATTARVPEASRSGSCSWPAEGGPDGPWADLREAAGRVWLESGRTLGAGSVLALLPGGLAGATPCRVRKCVRGPGIRGMAPSSEKRAAIPDEGAPAGPGLAKRDLTGPVPVCSVNTI